MKRTFSKVLLVVACSMVMGMAWQHITHAEEVQKVMRKVLLKQDMTIPDKEVVMIAVEIQPGAEEGRHTHPAELYAMVQEGSLLLENEGKNDTVYKAGDAFYVAPGKIHNGKNNGTVVTKLTAFLAAEKGKPLSAPVK